MTSTFFSKEGDDEEECSRKETYQKVKCMKGSEDAFFGYSAADQGRRRAKSIKCVSMEPFQPFSVGDVTIADIL